MDKEGILENIKTIVGYYYDNFCGIGTIDELNVKEEIVDTNNFRQYIYTISDNTDVMSIVISGVFSEDENRYIYDHKNVVEMK